MILGKDVLISNLKREALRYQPSFDLRQNIAEIIARHTGAAIRKGITLDIFVDPETPNYFQGNGDSFLEMLAQLLQHSIGSMTGGEINIRIHHESPHRNNSCKTELSIIITRHHAAEYTGLPETYRFPAPAATGGSNHHNGCASLQRIRHLCCHVDGSFTLQRLSDRKIQYLVSFILQQTHPAGMLHLV